MREETADMNAEKHNGGRTALIVIDLQTAMFDGVATPPIYEADALAERSGAVIEWARQRGLDVAFIRHDGPPGDPLAPAEPGWPLLSALGRREEEPIFSKTVGDAFSQPALKTWLQDRGAHKLVLIGAQTDECVAATVSGGLQNGYDVVVLSDVHSTWPQGGETAAQIIARHNDMFADAGARVMPAADIINDGDDASR